jgi:hypothetical protein
VGARFPKKATDVPLLHRDKVGSGNHLESYSMDTKYSFPREKEARA